MENEREYTRKDFANVIEHYLYTKNLNDKDIKVLQEIPFCMCTAFEGYESLKKRYEDYLWKLAEKRIIGIDELPDYVVLDADNYGDWQNPDYDILPALEKVNLVSVTFADGKTKLIKDTLYNVERTLLKRGYRYIRPHDYNSKVVYFKD